MKVVTSGGDGGTYKHEQILTMKPGSDDTWSVISVWIVRDLQNPEDNFFLKGSYLQFMSSVKWMNLGTFFLHGAQTWKWL